MSNKKIKEKIGLKFNKILINILKHGNSREKWFQRKILFFLTILMLSAGGSRLEGGIRCGPYLQMPGDSSMGVAWETTNPSGGYVEYGEGIDTLGEVKSLKGKTMQFVVLKGLKPSAEYWYRVVSDGDQSQKYTFRTAPKKEQNDVETRIVIWSDMQFPPNYVNEDGTVKPGMPGGEECLSALKANLEQMVKFKPHLQFVIGDLVNSAAIDSEVLWRHFFNSLKPLCASAPLMSVPGNHDRGKNNKYALYCEYLYLPENPPNDKIKELCYSFDYGNMHFSGLPYINWKSLVKKSGWLDSDLAAAKSRGIEWLFTGTHEDWEGGDKGPGSLDLQELDKKYGVAVNFNGHRHTLARSFPVSLKEDLVRFGAKSSTNRNYYNGKTKGTVLVRTGTLAAEITNGGLGNWDIINTRKGHNFALMVVKGKRLSFSTYTSDGKCIDSFVIDRNDLTDTANPDPVISDIKTDVISGYAADITWKTDVSSYSSVEYALSADSKKVKSTPVIEDLSSGEGKKHKVRLCFLTPGAEYCFRVKNRSGEKWARSEWQVFKTPAGHSGQLVGILDFDSLRGFQFGGTTKAGMVLYAEDLGFGWLNLDNINMGQDTGYSLQDGIPELGGLDPLSAEGRYRMAVSRVRIANRSRIPFRIDIPNGKYKLRFGLGTLFANGYGKIRIENSSFLRSPWSDLKKYKNDWLFRNANIKVIRVKGDKWDGGDEFEIIHSVTDGKLIFDVGAEDQALPFAGAWWEGLGLGYLIVESAEDKK
ncbi:MAG: fibronectin type III domain-containing protein [Candidatus Firestonebacteria bacterium]